RVFAGLYFEFPNGKKRVLLVQQRASGEWCLPGGPIKLRDFGDYWEKITDFSGFPRILFLSLSRQLKEQLGIDFPLSIFESGASIVFCPSIGFGDIAFLIKVEIDEFNDPGLLRLFKEKFVPNPEILQCALVSEQDLYGFEIIDLRMQKLIEFVFE
ncbi:hypothetical protein H5T58_01680, partial [Candidatus Parcubacteria bacterium]|nr:hypothetical protein [Candidatus Parcubacteria bacterium]